MAANPARRPGEENGRNPGGEPRQGELASFASLALQGADPDKLMAAASRVVREELGVEFVSVMELSDDEQELTLRAGEGWREGVVGDARIAVGRDAGEVSMATYALWEKDPVRSEDLAAEPRFGGCRIMDEHGIKSGVMAKIRIHGELFGLLGAHSRETRNYDKDEASWLADLAGMLGGGLGRGRLPLTGTETDGGADLDDAMERIAASASGAGGGGGALVETARVAASELADWCFVDLLDERGNGETGTPRTIRRIAIGTDLTGERGRRLARELSYPLDPGAPHGTPKVLRSGEYELIRRVDDAVLRRSANDPVHLGSLRDLDPKSYLVVPIHVDLRPVGTLVLVSTDPARRFDGRAVRRAKRLARCAALVLAGRAEAPAATPSGTPSLAPDLGGRDRPVVVRTDDGGGSPSAEVLDEDGRLAAAKAIGIEPRQLEVLELLDGGASRKEVAEKLYCSENTVKDHIRKAYRALGAKTRVAALARARELGLLNTR